MMLAIHGYKARIVTANINPKSGKVYIRCSSLVQFDGFKSPDERPETLIKTRDHFFRWLNPICQGETELEDSKNAPELVLRRKPGGSIYFKPLPRRSEDSGTESQSSASS